MVYPVECCRSCYYATGKKCSCSCNGKYHGKGLITQTTIKFKKLIGKECIQCGVMQDINKTKCGICGKIEFEKVFI